MAWNQFKFYLITWMSRNKDRFPRWIILTACAGCALFIAAVGCTVAHPYGSEIAQNALITAGLAINAALALFAFVLLSAAILWNFKRGITVTFETPSGLLPSGWKEPDIYPDILIATKPGESGEQFAARMDSARANAAPHAWVVVIPFRHPGGIVWSGENKYFDFLRDAPPFQQPGAELICPSNTFFHEESQSDYQAYLSRFCGYFREWSARMKFAREENSLRKIETFRASLNVLFFALLSLPIFAQSRADVSRTLGKYAHIIPEKGARIEYIFDGGKSHFRTGTGRENYLQILEGIPGFRYPKSALIAVTNNGETVAKADRTGDIAASTMRPYSQAVEPPQMQIPDSVRMAEMARDAKRQIWEMTEAANDAVEPWWDVVMFAFWRIFPFLVLFGAISWFVARVSAAEGMYELHKKARAAFAILAMMSGAVVLVNCLLYAMSRGAGPFPLFIIAACETYIAYLVVSRLVPDFRPARGNSPMMRRNDHENPTLLLP